MTQNTMSDDRKYIAVFVCSEGSTSKDGIAWSRAKTPVMEIGDLSEEESMEYLIKNHKIKEFHHFTNSGLHNFVLDQLLNNFFCPFSALIKQQVLDKVEKKFKSAQLLPNDQYYELGKSLICDLLKSNELSFLEFKNYFDRAEKLNEVLDSNIFSYHPEKNIVTFQSQSVKSYIQEKANIFHIYENFKIIEID
ncbi:uncharacterized protein OCT59_010545 [Rhizophagus irregularis]|uniref:uncharacterized protein n=1 Tax=Rhizophagus irregularis TaxID=588596 RepID=UPI00333287F2|nr:hypothetical protein OCT59_010545 [Rhizophagus irregularis]